MEKSVFVVGSGPGVLVTALHLLIKGYKITVIEVNNKAGGRLGQTNGDELFENVCYAGASTIPQTSLPMVLINSKKIVYRIEDFAEKNENSK